MSVLLVCLSFCARRSLFVGLGGRLPRKCATVSFVVGQSFISLQPLTIATSCMPTTVSCMSCIWQESEGTWRTSSTTAHYTEMFRRMVSNRRWTRISSSPQRSGQLKVSPRPEPKWLRLFLSKGVRLALALSHSRSLSLSLPGVGSAAASRLPPPCGHAHPRSLAGGFSPQGVSHRGARLYVERADKTKTEEEGKDMLPPHCFE